MSGPNRSTTKKMSNSGSPSAPQGAPQNTVGVMPQPSAGTSQQFATKDSASPSESAAVSRGNSEKSVIESKSQGENIKTSGDELGSKSPQNTPKIINTEVGGNLLTDAGKKGGESPAPPTQGGSEDEKTGDRQRASSVDAGLVQPSHQVPSQLNTYLATPDQVAGIALLDTDPRSPSANVQRMIGNFPPGGTPPQDGQLVQMRKVLTDHKNAITDGRQAGAIAHAVVQTAANSTLTFGVGLSAGTAIASLISKSPGLSESQATTVKLMGALLAQPLLAGAVNHAHQHSLHRVIQHMPMQFKPVPVDILVPGKLFEAMELDKAGSGVALKAKIGAEQGKLATLNNFDATIGGSVGFGAAAFVKDYAAMDYGQGYALAMGGSFVGGTSTGSGLAHGKHNATIQLPKFSLQPDIESGTTKIVLEKKPNGEFATEPVNLFYARKLNKAEMTKQSQDIVKSLPVTAKGNVMSVIGKAREVAVPFSAMLAVNALADVAIAAAANRFPASKIILPVVKAIVKVLTMAALIPYYFKVSLPAMARNEKLLVAGEAAPAAPPQVPPQQAASGPTSGPA